MGTRKLILSGAGTPVAGLVAAGAVAAIIGHAALGGHGPQSPSSTSAAHAPPSRHPASLGGSAGSPGAAESADLGNPEPTADGADGGLPGAAAANAAGVSGGGVTALAGAGANDAPGTNSAVPGPGGGGAQGGTGATGGTGGGSSGGGGRCFSGPWPISITKIHPGSPAGVYLQSDGDGLYLEVTHPGGRTVVFSGSLTSDGALQAIPFKLEPDDTFTVSPDGHTLAFRFVNHGALDGVAVTTSCGSYVTLHADNGSKPSRLVRPGGLRPENLRNPATITRAD